MSDGTNSEILDKVVDSIVNLSIPSYEIIIVGNAKIDARKNVRAIYFDENIRPGWITKKKNLITLAANFQIIVYLHDYFVFDSRWYEEVKQFGTDFDICMHRVENFDATRFRDWLLWIENDSLMDSFLKRTRRCLIPYEEVGFEGYMYISGGYWMAKRSFMMRFPLDEERIWGEGEDVEWSLRSRDTWNYKMNPKAVVRSLKRKDTHFTQPSRFELHIMRLLILLDKHLFKR